jgi:hypothetical protein
MPIYKINVKEYSCAHCGYRWINRTNGKDGPIPKNCARCKRSNWNSGVSQRTRLQENGLRRRIKGFKEIYALANNYFNRDKYGITETIIWSEELTEKFLNLTPPPTIPELKTVVFPPGLRLEPLDSQNHFYRRGCAPDPERPGYLKYSPKSWITLRREEAETRQKLMQRIIDSRSRINPGTQHRIYSAPLQRINRIIIL